MEEEWCIPIVEIYLFCMSTIEVQLSIEKTKWLIGGIKILRNTDSRGTTEGKGIQQHKVSQSILTSFCVVACSELRPLIQFMFSIMNVRIIDCMNLFQ